MTNGSEKYALGTVIVTKQLKKFNSPNILEMRVIFPKILPYFQIFGLVRSHTGVLHSVLLDLYLSFTFFISLVELR